jgi:hypothetical protein
MCLYSGANTISLTAATSLLVSWPGLVRGHDERSVSSQAFSARRQAWYRPDSNPKMRRMMAKILLRDRDDKTVVPGGFEGSVRG